jgi:hypothetical protein
MMTTNYQNIHSYIQTQIENYKQEIELPGGWKWGMKDHLDTSYLYINSQLKTGKDDFKPVKNITRPILNLQHRTEDIELRDVQIYADSPQYFHLSFLVKKYHDDVFVQENDLDTYFDELNVSRIDYGAGLSKHLNQPAPEVVQLHTIAFCDQTNILSGPLGIEHFYNPDELMAMAKFGWGDSNRGANISLTDLIYASDDEKTSENTISTNTTPGRYVKIIEVHGNFPKRWIDPSASPEEFSLQMHIIPMCKKSNGDGYHEYTLYAAEESELPFKLIKRDPVFGRALGFGGAEELFEAQVWTNYDMIRKQNMLDAAAVTILKTTDPNVATRNRIRDMENLDIVELQEGTDISQVDTFPRNMALFDRSMEEWQSHAQQMGSASDAILGESPATNTPFKLQDLVVRQNAGLHEYRKGQYAKHLEEVYNDWIIPHIQNKILNGATFLSELSLEEMQYVTDRIVDNLAKRKVVDMVLDGEEPTQEEIDAFKELTREDFKKRGNKHFITILKDEFKGVRFKVKVTISGKSKDMGARTDNLVNVFRQIIANPGVLRIPAIARIFNDILQSSGLEPADFTGITEEQLGMSNPAQGQEGTEQALTQPALANTPQQA